MILMGAFVRANTRRSGNQTGTLSRKPRKNKRRTCRAGKELDAAIAACKEWGLNFDAVNQSLPEWIEAWGSDSRKVGADEYWDDKAVIADTTCILRSATCYQRKNK